MNTTHSISNLSCLDAGPYTSIGYTPVNRKTTSKSGFSIILMDSSALKLSLREEHISNLLSTGASEIICLEKNRPRNNISMQNISRKIDNLRFLIFLQESTWGARINTAIRECSTPCQFVLKGNMNIHNIDLQMITKTSALEQLCTVPWFQDEMGDFLPTVFGPIIVDRNRFETRLVHPAPVENDTLVPWDYTAIYNKDKHMALGGFEPEITQPWWQKLEYGLRAWLWGEQIKTHSSLILQYIGQATAEDYSPNSGYSRLFFKTLAVRQRKNQGRFPGPLTQILGDMNSLMISRGQIRKLRSWVRENRHRYTQDALKLAKQWNWSHNGKSGEN